MADSTCQHWPGEGVGQGPPTPATPPAATKPGTVQVSPVVLVAGIIGALFVGWVGGRIADRLFEPAWQRTKRALR